jgi:DNA-binding NarL/FixJ family response regulator
VVGVGTMAEIPRLVVDLAPDVVVELGERRGDLGRVAVVSLVDEPAAVWAQRARTGAPARDGFAVLPHDALPDELWAAVFAAAAGLAVTRPAALPADEAPDAPRGAAAERLSSREVDVLSELARGSGNKQIAARLGISEHTVKFHVGSIFAKLGVSSRTEAVTRGVRLGLIML